VFQAVLLLAVGRGENEALLGLKKWRVAAVAKRIADSTALVATDVPRRNRRIGDKGGLMSM
jgi:hypothetical protein